MSEIYYKISDNVKNGITPLVLNRVFHQHAVGQAAGSASDAPILHRRPIESTPRPPDAGDTGFSAAPLRDERVKGFRPPDEPFPALGVCIPDMPGIHPAQPRIEPVIPHPQSHVSDALHQSLVQVDAAVLHAEGIKPVLCLVVGPLGKIQIIRH